MADSDVSTADSNEAISERFLLLLQRELQSDPRYESFLRIMSEFKENRIDMQTACRKVQNLFRTNTVILKAFNRLIPGKFRVQVQQAASEFQFLRRLQEETDSTVASEFAALIEKWRRKKATADGVIGAARRLLKRSPRLYAEFAAAFAVYIEEDASDQPTKHRKPNSAPIPPAVISDLIDPIEPGDVKMFQRVKVLLTRNSPQGYDYFNEFARCLDLFTTCIITKKELIALVEPLFEVWDVTLLVKSAVVESESSSQMQGVIAVAQSAMQRVLDSLVTVISSRECSRRKSGWFFRPFSDLSPALCPRHGHSYFLTSRLRTSCSRRPAELQRCLNSLWVSVPYGSEDFSFMQMRKNNCEEALFRVEDERFESDLAVAQVEALVARLEEEQAEERRAEGYRLAADVLSPRRLKALALVYGERAAQFEALLRRDPAKAIPVLLARMKAKLKNWTEVAKPEKERIWSETAERNFAKSLDYRCFAFKQNEKKFASSKAFLTEAKSRFDHRSSAIRRLWEYTETRQCDYDYEFIGGSKNRLFYCSFVGTMKAIPHFVPREFRDTVLLQSRNLTEKGGRDVGPLPQFRLLLNCRSVVVDAFGVVSQAVDKTPAQTKEKVAKVLSFLASFLRSGTTLQSSEPAPYPCLVLPAPQIRSRSGGPCPGFLPLREQDALLYAPASTFVLFRFLHAVYERLLKVKFALAAVHEGRSYECQPAVVGAEYDFTEKVERDYSAFLKTVHALQNGQCDLSHYEEQCEKMINGDAYMLFTLKKLVKNTAKALLAAVSDEHTVTAFSLYMKYSELTQFSEEVYLSDFAFQTKNAPSAFFRLLWDPKFSNLSIHYVEHPYDRLNPASVCDSLAYFSALVSADCDRSCLLYQQLRPMLRRLDRYFAVNRIGDAAFARRIIMRNSVCMALDANLKIAFQTGGEDSLFSRTNTHFVSYVKDEDCLYVFTSKAAFAEKMIEISETTFQKRGCAPCMRKEV